MIPWLDEDSPELFVCTAAGSSYRSNFTPVTSTAAGLASVGCSSALASAAMLGMLAGIMTVDVAVIRTVRGPDDPFTGAPVWDIGSRTIGWMDADDKSIEIEIAAAPLPDVVVGIYTVANELDGMPLPKVVFACGTLTVKDTGGALLSEVLVAWTDDVAAGS
jgi:hypothetical protein